MRSTFAYPENSNILQLGQRSFIRIASSIPDNLGIVTLEISRSGASDFALLRTSKGLEKDEAENPFSVRIATTVSTMTGSSLMTKMRNGRSVLISKLSVPIDVYHQVTKQGPSCMGKPSLRILHPSSCRFRCS